MENPIKMDDLGIPLFLETPVFWTPRSGLRSTFCSIAPPCTMKPFSITCEASCTAKTAFLVVSKNGKKNVSPPTKKTLGILGISLDFFACATYMSVAYAISGKFSHLRIDEPRGPSKQDQQKSMSKRWWPVFCRAFLVVKSHRLQHGILEFSKKEGIRQKWVIRYQMISLFILLIITKTAQQQFFFFVAKSPSSKKIDLKTSSLDILCSWACLVYVQL